MASFQKTSLETIELKTPKLKAAPLVVDDWTLAFRLGFSGKALWYVVGRRTKLYKVFKIKKASGGLRIIHAPNRIIELFLKQLRTRILMPLAAALGPHVGAYQIGKSTKDSAVFHLHPCATCAPGDQPHTCKEYVVEKTPGKGGVRVVRADQGSCVACQPIPKHACARRGVKLHLDLKDFFGSTRRAWIRRYFTEVVGYNHYVSSLLSSIMTVEFVRERNGKTIKYQGVPQGAPTSGDICNLVADWRLDQPVLAALKGTGWVYSRYADDIYLSHPQNLSRDAVNHVIEQMNALIINAGYRMNRKKLHVQRPNRRQQLLGVVLNQKINIPYDQYKRMKAILNNCLHNGFDAEAGKKGAESTGKFLSWIQGRLSYMKMVNPQKTQRLKAMFDLAKQRHLAQQPMRKAA
jgi:retron-type reverse transcriptase